MIQNSDNDVPNPINDNKKNDRLSLVEMVALFLFGALMIVVLLQFCTRYFLNDSLAWTEEIARYLLVGVVFSGSLMLARRGEHIFLEVTYRLTPLANAKPLAIVSASLSFIYYLILAIFAFLLALETKQLLISIQFPKALIYGFVALTLALSALATLSRLIHVIRLTNSQIIAEMNSSSNQSDSI